MAFILPGSMADIATKRLRQMIVTGKLEFGQKIIESELQPIFGLSKTPIREALLRLREEKLVDIRPRKGTFVFKPTEKDLEDLCTMRTILESSAIKIGMASNPQGLIRELRDNIKVSLGHVESNNVKAYLKCDGDFHAIILKYAMNGYIDAAYGAILAKVRAIRNRLPQDDVVHISVTDHQHLVSILEQGKIIEAIDLLGLHVQRAFLDLAKQNLFGRRFR